MTDTTTISLLHPGEMGAGVGAALRESGHRVLYASEGRSEETVHRAMRAGLLDVREVAELASSPIILSICPPHAAIDVAHSFPGFSGIYVDANAVSPTTAERVRSIIEGGGGTYVDGGIIGGQPFGPGRTTLYLSGDAAASVAPYFASEHLDVGVLDGPVTSASALKMAFASWTKGTSALILASRALARAYGVEGDLLAEWAGGPGSSGDESELATRSRVPFRERVPRRPRAGVGTARWTRSPAPTAPSAFPTGFTPGRLGYTVDLPTTRQARPMKRR